MGLRVFQQLSFTAGEIGPNFDGRFDTDLRASSCQTILNWIQYPQGPLKNRRGFKFIDTVDDSRERLVEFYFNDNQHYLMLFGDYRVKIYIDNYLQATVTTPYSIEQVQYINFAQDTDTMVIAHSDFHPKELYRNGSHTSWLFRDYTITDYPTWDFGDGEVVCWSDTYGYPSTVTFRANRIAFGGTKRQPDVLWFSQASGLDKFTPVTASDVKDDDAFELSLNADTAHQIKQMKSNQNSFIVLTTMGEWAVKRTAEVFGPSTVEVKQQTSYGIGDVKPVQVKDELLYITNNRKECIAYTYSLEKDQYVGKNYTMIAHHILNNPYDMAYLRSYSDTQANTVFVSNEDGSLSVLTVDVDKEVLGWVRWETQGKFKSLSSVYCDHGDGQKIETLYAIVERANGPTLECLTEEEVYFDCFFDGSVDVAKKEWELSSDILDGLEVGVVGDGVRLNNTTINSKTLTTEITRKSVNCGLVYDNLIEIHPIRRTLDGAVVSGKQCVKKKAIVNVADTNSITVDGKIKTSRKFGPDLLNNPLPLMNETLEVILSGSGKDIVIPISTTSGLSSTVLSLEVHLKTK